LLGIGGVTAGATSYGEVDDAVSLDALARALDLASTSTTRQTCTATATAKICWAKRSPPP